MGMFPVSIRYACPDVVTVWTLMGATVGVTVSFILPPLFYLRCTQLEDDKRCVYVHQLEMFPNFVVADVGRHARTFKSKSSSHFWFVFCCPFRCGTRCTAKRVPAFALLFVVVSVHDVIPTAMAQLATIVMDPDHTIYFLCLSPYRSRTT